MRKPNKREVILAGILAAAVLFSVSLDSQVKKKRSLNREYWSQSVTTLSPAGETTRADLSRAAKLETAGLNEQWGLDPFSRFFTRTPAGEGTGRPARPQRVVLKLHGVLYAGSEASALIGSEIVAEGDTIRHYLVESINGHEVLLKSVVDGSRLRLKVE